MVRLPRERWDHGQTGTPVIERWGRREREGGREGEGRERGEEGRERDGGEGGKEKQGEEGKEGEGREGRRMGGKDWAIAEQSRSPTYAVAMSLYQIMGGKAHCVCQITVNMQ